MRPRFRFFGFICKYLALTFSLALTCEASAQAPEALFYMTKESRSVQAFIDHVDKIDLLAPGWYDVNEEGLVSGGPNILVLNIAKEQKIGVMPIVANFDFNQKDFHAFVHNEKARQSFLDQLVKAAKQYGYVGFQFDFEHVDYLDRDALSTQVQEAYHLLHQNGLLLSIAVVPNVPDKSIEGAFGAFMFRNWRGAYDLQALSPSVDFVCLMTYSIHNQWTTPGPISAWQWALDNIDFALKSVPPSKLSVGIPLFGYRWYTGAPHNQGTPTESPNPTAERLTGAEAVLLAKSRQASVNWDPVDHTAWTWYYRDYNREWVFFTDERSFKERYDLVRNRKLRGFCAWVLGEEDPSIWAALPKRTR